MPIALARVCFEGEERKWRGLAAMSQFDPERKSYSPVCCEAQYPFDGISPRTSRAVSYATTGYNGQQHRLQCTAVKGAMPDDDTAGPHGRSGLSPRAPDLADADDVFSDPKLGT